MLAGIAYPEPAAAQGRVVDAYGNLTEMPFVPDYPVLRSEVRREGEETFFDTYTSMPYEELVQHYRDVYDDRVELAPGWTIAGFGYNVVEGVQQFTLTYAGQMYRILVRPDEATGGTLVSVRARGSRLMARPFLYTVMPYRALDVGPIPATTF
jgi:hypothetical protein